MQSSSNQKVRKWPYVRYEQYRKMLEEAAEDWFARHNLSVRPKSPYILTEPCTWKDNIIMPEVATLIEQIRKER